MAVGDLNGAVRALRTILRGVGLVDRRDRWTGRDAVLIQVGDVFNRGDGAREAFELLRSLRAPARDRGGDVVMLLGNHEIMTALGNEAYCTVGEYLSFATARQRAAWPARRARAIERLYRGIPKGRPIPPLAPRLAAWEVENVPGRAEMRRALGPSGRIGRVLRSMAVAARVGDLVFVHAGLRPHLARRGLETVNALGREAWSRARFGEPRRLRSTVLGDPDGPLWDRQLAKGRSRSIERTLAASLRTLDARRLVVGHCATATLPQGRTGRILMRHGKRLACIDTGICDETPESWAALTIDASGGHEWRPDGVRRLWRDRRPPGRA